MIECRIENDVLVVRIPLRIELHEKEIDKISVSGNVQLSPREGMVLDLLCKNNLSNKEIATQMNIAERTVKFHMSNLIRKFGCETRAELIYRFR